MNSLLYVQGGPEKASVDAMAQLIDTIFSGAHAARLSDETVQEALKAVKDVFGVRDMSITNCNFTGKIDSE